MMDLNEIFTILLKTRPINRKPTAENLCPNFKSFISSSNSSLLLNIGKDPPADLHIKEASTQDFLVPCDFQKSSVTDAISSL